jgi:hypothetical protein
MRDRSKPPSATGQSLCRQPREGAVVDADETGTSTATAVPEAELSPEQRATLEKLNRETPNILARFDEVLREFGIERQVHQFTLVRQRAAVPASDELGAADEFAPLWCCCVNPPPDEAPCGECRKVDEIRPVE